MKIRHTRQRNDLAMPLRDFKSYSNRALSRVEGPRTRWSRGGSTRRLPTPEAVRAAVRYAAAGEGEEMALFVAQRGGIGG